MGGQHGRPRKNPNKSPKSSSQKSLQSSKRKSKKKRMVPMECETVGAVNEVQGEKEAIHEGEDRSNIDEMCPQNKLKEIESGLPEEAVDLKGSEVLKRGLDPTATKWRISYGSYMKPWTRMVWKPKSRVDEDKAKVTPDKPVDSSKDSEWIEVTKSSSKASKSLSNSEASLKVDEGRHEPLVDDQLQRIVTPPSFGVIIEPR